MWYGCVSFIWYMVCIYNQWDNPEDAAYPMETDPWNLVDDFMATRAYEHLLYLDEFVMSMRLNITYSGWEYFGKVEDALHKEMRKAKHNVFGFQICYGFYKMWCESGTEKASTYDEVLEELRFYVPGVAQGIEMVDSAGFSYDAFLLGDYSRGWEHGYE